MHRSLTAMPHSRAVLCAQGFFANDSHLLVKSPVDRIAKTIQLLETDVEVSWPSIVEHLTDTDYCFTAKSFDEPYNHSRGGVCFKLASDCLNRGYSGLMPMESSRYHFSAPYFFDPEQLQKWLRDRRNKPLYELQIEAANWAISIIPTHSRSDGKLQAAAIEAIRSKIATLRRVRKSLPGCYFSEARQSYKEAEVAGVKPTAATSPSNTPNAASADSSPPSE